MSQTILRRAVVSRLKTTLALRDNEVDLQEGPEPDPMAAEFYISVHPGPWSGQDEDHYLDELHGLQVTLSVKGARFPIDRWGERLVNSKDRTVGMEYLLRRIVKAIHRDYDLLTAANDLLSGDTHGFVEPLRFRDGGMPVARPASWWGASGDSASARPSSIATREKRSNVNVGLSQTLLFTGARRVQEMGNLT